MRPFIDALRDWRRGRVAEQLTDEMSALVASVMEHSKPGSLTLKVTVKPHGRGDNALTLSAQITTKRPQGETPEAIFFADVDGGLHRDDPTQQRLFADATPSAANTPHDPATGEVLEA